MAYIFLIEHKWAMQRISGRGFENWTWPSPNVAKKGKRVCGREERPWGGGGLKLYGQYLTHAFLPKIF